MFSGCFPHPLCGYPLSTLPTKNFTLIVVPDTSVALLVSAHAPTRHLRPRRVLNACFHSASFGETLLPTRMLVAVEGATSQHH